MGNLVTTEMGLGLKWSWNLWDIVRSGLGTYGTWLWNMCYLVPSGYKTSGTWYQVDLGPVGPGSKWV
jgi:hypothetical protein